jgi:hypothetical protein
MVSHVCENTQGDANVMQGAGHGGARRGADRKRDVLPPEVSIGSEHHQLTSRSISHAACYFFNCLCGSQRRFPEFSRDCR